MGQLVRWQPAEVWRRTRASTTRATHTLVFTGKLRLIYRRRLSIDEIGGAHLATQTSVRGPKNFQFELKDEITFTELNKAFFVDEVMVNGAIISDTPVRKRGG